MKYKILGAALAFAGMILIAKYQLHLIGLILLFLGDYGDISMLTTYGRYRN